VATLLSNISADILKSNKAFQSMPIKIKAITIIRYMRSIGFLGCQDSNYQDLVNSFLGSSIQTTRTTLPIISCSIFCALASRLDIRAYPCAYPYHVYVLVRDENSSESHFYLDPHFGEKIISQEDLELRLQEMGITITPLIIAKYLEPASISELVLRSARNILRSTANAKQANLTTSASQFTLLNINAAEYASLFAIAILSNSWTIRILDPICRLLRESFPSDVAFLERYIAPIAGADSQAGRMIETLCLTLRSEDCVARKPRRRPPNLLFRIGTIFIHKKYGYLAVITGWTMDMAHNDVSYDERDLRRGVAQPFYSALVSDLSTRYVAEENILEQRPQSVESLRHVKLGMYFRNFNPSMGRFVSNMREEYPDD